MKLKNVKQTSGLCGPASLSSLLHFYGLNMSESKLARLSGATPEAGVEPEALVQALKKLKFKPVAKNNGTLADLKRLVTHETPVLINWWSDYSKPADGHYSVVYRMTDRSIYLMDPEQGGSRRMTRRKFMRQWYDYYQSGKRNARWYLYIAK